MVVGRIAEAKNSRRVARRVGSIWGGLIGVGEAVRFGLMSVLAVEERRRERVWAYSANSGMRLRRTRVIVLQQRESRMRRAWLQKETIASRTAGLLMVRERRSGDDAPFIMACPFVPSVPFSLLVPVAGSFFMTSCCKSVTQECVRCLKILSAFISWSRTSSLALDSPLWMSFSHSLVTLKSNSLKSAVRIGGRKFALYCAGQPSMSAVDSFNNDIS
jgi:hypothetical protein